MIDIYYKVIDWFEKFFKRFKVIGYFIVIGFLIFYLIENGFERKRTIEFAEKLTGLNIERNLLIKEKFNISKERDSVINQNIILKKQKDSALILKDQEAWRSAKYRRERNEARKALIDYTSNESYDFLDKEAYPFIGKKEYGFNAKQVFGMHKTFVENEFNKDIIESQIAELDYCNDALVISDEIEKSNDEIIEMAVNEISIDKDIMNIDKEKAELTMKQWKKERRKRIWGKAEKWIYAVGAFFIGAASTK